MTASESAKNIVLLGLGHTHAHVVKQWAHASIPGARLYAISNFLQATYSGMLPGVLAGDYQAQQMQIDLVHLCHAAGVRLINEDLLSVNRKQRQLSFASGRRLNYDVLSVAVGSQPPLLPGMKPSGTTGATCFSIKPMQTFLPRLDAAIANVLAEPRSSGSPISIVVIGGGLGSLEVAMCLPKRLNSHGITEQDFRMTVVSGSANPPEGCLDSTRKQVQKVLADRGVQLLRSAKATGWSEGVLQLEDGAQLEADLAIYVGAGNASPVTRLLDVSLDSRDCILTNNCLQSVDDPLIWAAGDCGSIQDENVPKAGVYAVRQGPVIWENVQRFLSQRPLESYRPQSDFLKLINAGNGTAIGQWKWWSFQGQWAWRLKDHIDTNFMAMYQKLASGGMQPSSATPIETREAEMRCLGCGGKVAGSALRRTLHQLAQPHDESSFHALQSGDTEDDVALLTHANGTSLAVTVDAMASPIDDPFLFGKIAGLHALSDLWASGIEPQGLTAAVEVPHVAGWGDDLQQVMSGLLSILTQHRVRLLGGHTFEGQRLQLSLSAMGSTVDEKIPLPKTGIQPGDYLITTKPIGIGIALAAAMRGECPAETYRHCLDVMLLPNAIALSLQEKFDIHAATDVTGFGLIGHLTEMIGRHDRHVCIRADNVLRNSIAGASDLIQNGIASTLSPANAQYLTQAGVAEIDPITKSLLIDPQTSGGLLFAVAEGDAEPCLQLLRRSSHPAWVLGRVSSQGKQAAMVSIV